MHDLITTYQQLLEMHRAYPDDEGIWEQLEAAKNAMITAWLEEKMEL